MGSGDYLEIQGKLMQYYLVFQSKLQNTCTFCGQVFEVEGWLSRSSPVEHRFWVGKATNRLYGWLYLFSLLYSGWNFHFLYQ